MPQVRSIPTFSLTQICYSVSLTTEKFRILLGKLRFRYLFSFLKWTGIDRPKAIQ
ncbi:hypothetical protein C789_1201 [Microcystis aeruginosa FACHB-905 = DIANCHI905]|nr:hypothetical protein C789_1201 [Microcystis aeruginosa FACHB-905 = DIANCHI905]